MVGYWNIYGCENDEHNKNVSFSICQESDQEEMPHCPVCGEKGYVKFIDTDLIESD